MTRRACRACRDRMDAGACRACDDPAARARSGAPLLEPAPRRAGGAIRGRGRCDTPDPGLPRRRSGRLRAARRADDRSRLPADEGHPADRRSRGLGRAPQPLARRHSHPDARRSLLGRLDAGRRDRDPDPRRRASRPLSLLPPLAPGRVHAVRDLHRVRHLPGHVARRPSRPPPRPPARDAARERELPVRPHSRLGRALRRSAARARLADREPARCGSCSGRSRSRFRPS